MGGHRLRGAVLTWPVPASSRDSAEVGRAVGLGPPPGSHPQWGTGTPAMLRAAAVPRGRATCHENRDQSRSQAQLSFPLCAHRCEAETPPGLVPASESASPSPWPRGLSGDLPPGRVLTPRVRDNGLQVREPAPGQGLPASGGGRAWQRDRGGLSARGPEPPPGGLCRTALRQGVPAPTVLHAGLSEGRRGPQSHRTHPRDTQGRDWHKVAVHPHAPSYQVAHPA